MEKLSEISPSERKLRLIKARVRKLDRSTNKDLLSEPQKLQIFLLEQINSLDLEAGEVAQQIKDLGRKVGKKDVSVEGMNKELGLIKTQIRDLEEQLVNFSKDDTSKKEEPQTEQIASANEKLAGIAVGTLISYKGDHYKVIEIPTEENKNKYILVHPSGRPIYKLTQEQLEAILSSGEAQIAKQEIKTPEEQKTEDIESIKILLKTQGIDLDNLQNENFDRLVKISSIVNLMIQRSSLPEVKNDIIANFLLEEADKIDNFIEVRGVEENRRLSRPEFNNLTVELEAAGLRRGYVENYTYQQLKKAKEIWGKYESKFPGNVEVMDHLKTINEYLEDSISTEEEWTDEDEQTLNTLLETIQDAKKRIAELDKAKEALPKTINLNRRDLEQEIEKNLLPLLRENNAVLNNIKIEFKGAKINLGIDLTAKKAFMSFPLSIKATIANKEESIYLENHSYDGSDMVVSKAREGLDPQIGNLVPSLIRFLENKYGRKISGINIVNDKLEINLAAKK